MTQLTDTAIRAAIQRVERDHKPISLTEGEGRGTGRLRLTIRPMPRGALAEWYAVQWRGDKRTQAKMGSYPAMSLKDARALFESDYGVAIQAGENIKHTTETKPGTVADLFTSYVAHLKASKKPSWVDAEKSLNKASVDIGANRLARDIKPKDIKAHLAAIYDRGSVSMADHVRSYIRSAFSWAIKSENDYRRKDAGRFKMETNPAAEIPTEPKKPGSKWLKPDEFKAVYDWLQAPDTTVTPHYCKAIQLLMMLGQRVTQIASLRAEQWNSADRTLDWGKMKNGRPHCIPVPEAAAVLLDSIKPNRHGWFFPSATDASKPVDQESLYCTLWRTRRRMPVMTFALRDLRRTWKTLAGHAGLTKHERDLIQHHSKHDVSTVHYDRYEYMAEKKVAMDKWNVWLVANVISKINHMDVAA